MATGSSSDVETKLDVGRSLLAVASLLDATGKPAEAEAAYLRAEALLADLGRVVAGGAGPAGGLPNETGFSSVQNGQAHHRPGGLSAGAGRPEGSRRRPRGIERGPARPGKHDQRNRQPAC